MRTTSHVLSLALVCCAVVLVHTTTATSQSSSGTSTQRSETLLPCAPANLQTGYSQDVKFAKSDRKVKVYDTDYDETHKHDPICLSKQNGDAIFWVSGLGKNFKLKVYPQDDEKTADGIRLSSTQRRTRWMDTFRGRSGPTFRRVVSTM